MLIGIKKYIITHKIISGVVVLILIGGYFAVQAFAGGTATPTYTLAKVTRGNLVTTISGTGQIEANQQIDLKFQSSGTIRSIVASQGDTVQVGEVIATLDQRSAGAALTQARSALTSAQASYDKVINGATATDVSISAATVDAARQSLIGKILETYTTADNLMRTVAYKFFINPKSDSPQFGVNYSSGNTNTTFYISDSSAVIKVAQKHSQANKTLTSWGESLQKLSLTTENIDAYILEANANIAFYAQYFNDLSAAVYGLEESAQFQTVINGYKNDASGARNSINSAATSLASSQASYTSAKLQYSQKVAPARQEDISTAQASLESAKASYQNALLTYDNTILKAPFVGQIGTLSLKIGDQASSGTSVGTLITPDSYAKISLNEVDVAKVKVGDEATITFDALSDITMKGRVAEVDSVGAVTSGVVNYGVKIALETQDARIKPGMSVSVVITANSKQDALIVPNAAVKSDTRGSYVQILPGIKTVGQVTSKEKPMPKAVTTGVSNETSSEIISGLEEGDVIIIRTTTGAKSTAVTKTSSTNQRTMGAGAPRN